MRAKRAQRRSVTIPVQSHQTHYSKLKGTLNLKPTPDKNCILWLQRGPPGIPRHPTYLSSSGGCPLKALKKRWPLCSRPRTTPTASEISQDRREVDSQAYVDGLDQVRPLPPMFVGVTLTAIPHQVISTLPSGSDDYYRSLRAPRRTCGIHGVLPTSFKVPQGLSLVTAKQMKRVFASGGFSDVWKAMNDKR